MELESIAHKREMVHPREKFREFRLTVTHLHKDPPGTKGRSDSIVLRGDHASSMHRVVKHSCRFGIHEDVAVGILIDIELRCANVDCGNPCGILEVIKHHPMGLPDSIIENNFLTNVSS